MRRAGGARSAHHRTTQAMPPKKPKNQKPKTKNQKPKTKNQKPKTKKAAISGFLSQAKKTNSQHNAKKQRRPILQSRRL